MKRVLVVHNDSPISAGVESILSHQDSLVIEGFTPANKMDLSRQIERFKPDVVVLDTSLPFSTLSRLLKLLSKCPLIRVIVLNIEDNQVQVYDKHQVWVESASDLVAIISRE